MPILMPTLILKKTINKLQQSKSQPNLFHKERQSSNKMSHTTNMTSRQALIMVSKSMIHSKLNRMHHLLEGELNLMLKKRPLLLKSLKTFISKSLSIKASLITLSLISLAMVMLNLKLNPSNRLSNLKATLSQT